MNSYSKSDLSEDTGIYLGSLFHFEFALKGQF